MAIKTIKDNKLTWYDITEVNDESIDYLKKSFQFHPLDLKDVRSFSERAKMDAYKNYLFMIYHYPELNKRKNILMQRELAVFMGDQYLVTVHKTRIKSIKDDFYKCLNNKKTRKEYFKSNSWYLLYQLLANFFASVYDIAEHFKKQIQVLEDEIFRPEKRKPPRELLMDLAATKRNILKLKGMLTPQRGTLANLEHSKLDFLSEDVAIYFDDILDDIEKLLVVLDSYKDSVQGLYESNESMISLTTNRTINILTSISAALMPLTLLSGIYGMNIVLPFSEQTEVIWAMYLFLAFAGVIGIFYLNKRGKL